MTRAPDGAHGALSLPIYNDQGMRTELSDLLMRAAGPGNDTQTFDAYVVGMDRAKCAPPQPAYSGTAA